MLEILNESIQNSKYVNNFINNEILLQSIDEDIKQQRYLSLALIGKGSFGYVCQIYDTKEKQYLAEKYFQVENDYSYEKKMMIHIEKKLFIKSNNNNQNSDNENNKNNSDIYAHMLGYSDENRKIIYQLGHCSLQNLIDRKRAQKIFWKEQDLLYIAWRLLDSCLQLYDIDIFHSDLKPANITIFSNDQTYFSQSSILTLIDFGVASPHYNYIKGFSQFFAIEQNLHSAIVKCKEGRLAFEAFQIGRIMQILIIFSEYFTYLAAQQDYFNHQEYHKFQIFQKNQIENYLLTLENVNINQQQSLEYKNLLIKLLKTTLIDSVIINKSNQQQSEFHQNIIELKQQFKEAYELKYKSSQQQQEQQFLENQSFSQQSSIVIDSTQNQGLMKQDNWELVQQIKKEMLEQFLNSPNDEQQLIENVEKFEKYDLQQPGFSQAMRLVDLYQKQIINHFLRLKIDYQKEGELQKNKQIIINDKDFIESQNNLINYTIQSYNFMIHFRWPKYCLDTLEQTLFQILQQKSLITDEDLSLIYTIMGSIYESSNRYSEAEKYMLIALEITRKTYGEESNEITKIYSELGSIYKNTGRLNESEKYFTLKLQQSQKIEPDNIEGISQSLSNLSSIQQSLGKLEEAEKSIRKAIELQISAFGEFCPELAINLQGLSDILRVQKKFQEAENSILKAIKIQQKAYGDNYHGLPNLILSLGTIYKDQGRIQEAEQKIKKSMELTQLIYGDQHINICQALFFLGEIKQSQGKYEEAEKLFLRALDIDQKIYDGTQNEQVMSDFCSLVKLYKEQRRFQEAKLYCYKCIDISTNILGQDNKTTQFFNDLLIEIEQNLSENQGKQKKSN